MRILVLIFSSFLLAGCLGYQETAKPVKNFELSKYLGKWYEIARLDHRFERGLEQISAEYSLRDDGGVEVINRGFSIKKQTWKQARGKAYFVEDENTGYFKVSFFGPFYGSYVIFELDQDNYQYAFVTGPDQSYLWFLSRTKKVSDELMQHFYSLAKEKGFNTAELILVDHTNE